MSSRSVRSLDSRASFTSLLARGATGLVALLLASACSSQVQDGTGGGDTGGGSGGGCVWNGETHAPGETFKDDCNTCTCEEDGTVGCTLIWCGDECVYEGQTYAPGASFPASDGCNTCTCDETGEVGCTEIACAETCTYGSATYQIGESFQASDGCNTCTCTEEGVACTVMACQCDPAAEHWREYVATDPETCQVIDFACPPNTQGFSNDCGCGCEQDPTCPPSFDCMPPKSCDLKKIAEECPYSEITM